MPILTDPADTGSTIAARGVRLLQIAGAVAAVALATGCGSRPRLQFEQSFSSIQERRLMQLGGQTAGAARAAGTAHWLWESEFAQTPGTLVLQDEDRVGSARRGAALAPLPAFWDTVKRDLRAWPGVFVEDSKTVYGNGANLLILGLGYGGALAVQQTGPDDTVEDSFRTHTTFKSGWRDAFGAAGSPFTHFGVAGLWYVVGQQAQDDRTYQVGTKLFRALAVNGVSTLLGKMATWDDAPNGEWGALPSGHTSSTFTLASVMHHEYGPLVGVPLYSLGALVGYARLEDEEHYLSDVLMGGLMGLVIGHSIAADGQPPSVWGGDVVPYVDPQGATTGVAWVKPLP